LFFAHLFFSCVYIYIYVYSVLLQWMFCTQTNKDVFRHMTLVQFCEQIWVLLYVFVFDVLSCSDGWPMWMTQLYVLCTYVWFLNYTHVQNHNLNNVKSVKKISIAHHIMFTIPPQNVSLFSICIRFRRNVVQFWCHNHKHIHNTNAHCAVYKHAFLWYVQTIG